MSTTTTTPRTTPFGLLRLVRASIAISPVADGVAGVTLAIAVGAADPMFVAPIPIVAGLACSLFLFLFGMSQNDLADRSKDAAARTERPIPAGQVSLGAARGVVASTAVMAIVLSWLAAPPARVLAGAILLTISVYNLTPRHAGPFGPVLLGLVRALNLTLGAALVGAPMSVWPVAAAYFLYIAGVSVIARMEDGEIRPSVARLRALLALAALCALCAPLLARLGVSWSLVAASEPPHPAWLLPALGIAAWLGWRIYSALGAFPPGDLKPGVHVSRLVGACLSGILLFDAAVCWAVAAWLPGVLLLASFPVSRKLAQRFPPS